MIISGLNRWLNGKIRKKIRGNSRCIAACCLIASIRPRLLLIRASMGLSSTFLDAFTAWIFRVILSFYRSWLKAKIFMDEGCSLVCSGLCVRH